MKNKLFCTAGLFLVVFLFSCKLSAQLPDIKGWLDDDYYLEKRVNDEGKKQIWKVKAKTGKSKLYKKQTYRNEINEKLPEGYSFFDIVDHTCNYEKNIIKKDNDLYYFSLKDNEFKRLTDDAGEENNATFSPDGTKIAFTKDHDLYVLNIETGQEKRLTHDGTDLIKNGYSSWVYWEEIHGRETNYKTFWWSPDGTMIAFERFDDRTVPEFPIFNAEGIHGELRMQRYPKAGDPNPGVRLGVIHLDKDEVTWIDDNDEEDVYIAFPMWTNDSKKLIYQKMNRDQNYIEILAADPGNGEKKEIYDEQQSTWIDFYTPDDLYILKNGSGFILRSDKDGWRKLYFYDMDENLHNKLTDVDWRVQNIAGVDEEKGWVYFEGTGEQSTDKLLFKVRIDGGQLIRLTDKPGYHELDISPGYSYFIDEYSNTMKPPGMFVYSNEGMLVRTIAVQEPLDPDSTKIGKVELFTITTEDGFDLPVKWILPCDFDSTKKYGVVFSIYGGPDYKGVSNKYTSPRGNFFTKNGVITIAVDHRASGHFGKEGLNYVYRNLGNWELKDYISMVKWLKTLPFIDSTKIGITGGSYGGYLTCLALTKGADYFTHGFGSSCGTDWRLYDDIYTERYMDTPEQNQQGYDTSAVAYYADKLKGKLYIVHGDMDDNVHLQHMIQLADKLTTLNKDFEMMIYPGGKHGWGPPKVYHTFREMKEFWIDGFELEQADK